TGLPVTIINKKISLGLTWAEIGPVFRLPGYASPEQFLIAGIVTGVRVVGAEMDFLGPAEQQQPGSGAAFVGAAHSLRMRAFADPANTEADWKFFASLGVDAPSTAPFPWAQICSRRFPAFKRWRRWLDLPELEEAP